MLGRQSHGASGGPARQAPLAAEDARLGLRHPLGARPSKSWPSWPSLDSQTSGACRRCHRRSAGPRQPTVAPVCAMVRSLSTAGCSPPRAVLEHAGRRCGVGLAGNPGERHGHVTARSSDQALAMSARTDATGQSGRSALMLAAMRWASCSFIGSLQSQESAALGDGDFGFGLNH